MTVPASAWAAVSRLWRPLCDDARIVEIHKIQAEFDFNGYLGIVVLHMRALPGNFAIRFTFERNRAGASWYGR